MHITKCGKHIQEGDFVRYKFRCGNENKNKEMIGKVSEIFDSMDRTFKCLWIEGENRLIREDQVVEKIEEPYSELQSKAYFNDMCHSCTLLGDECQGTSEQAWTGCVWRRPDHLMTITVIRPQAVNYTPADLMNYWAKEHGGQFYCTQLGSARLAYQGKTWGYDHWTIQKTDDDMEQITLYLVAERTDHGRKAEERLP